MLQFMVLGYLMYINALLLMLLCYQQFWGRWSNLDWLQFGFGTFGGSSNLIGAWVTNHMTHSTDIIFIYSPFIWQVFMCSPHLLSIE